MLHRLALALMLIGWALGCTGFTDGEPSTSSDVNDDDRRDRDDDDHRRDRDMAEVSDGSMVVAVLYFDNHTGDPGLDALGKGMDWSMGRCAWEGAKAKFEGVWCSNSRSESPN